MGRTKKASYDEYNDFDTLIASVKISERFWKFFQSFTDQKAQTFGNAIKSYHAAGYTENATSKYRAKDIYNHPLIQKLLSLWHKKTAEKRENRDISVFDHTDIALLWALEMAKDRNDYAAVQSIAMNRAKLHGLLVERHQVIDPDTESRIDKSVRFEAARIAERRLLESGDKTDSKDDLNIIDADIVRPIESDCPTELSNDPDDSAITACIVGENAA